MYNVCPADPFIFDFSYHDQTRVSALSAANCNNHRQDSPHAHSWVSGYSPWDILGTGTNRLKQDRQLRTDYAETMVHFFSALWPRSSAPVLGAVLVGVFIGALPRSLRGHLGSEEMGKWPESCKCVHVPVRNRHCHQARRRAQHVAREQAGEIKRPGPRRTRRVKFTPPCVL